MRNKLLQTPRQLFDPRRLLGGALDDQLALALPLGHGDLELAVSLAFEDAALGATKTLEFRRPFACSRCLGRGYEPGRPADPCAMCRGSLLEYRSAQLKVTFPGRLTTGARLRLAGEGLPGYPPGDLYLAVRVREHKYFTAAGADIWLDVTVSAVHAVVGAVISVPSLYGPAFLGIPPGAQHGTRLRLAGLGLPLAGGGRGDQWVTLHLRVPTRLRPHERVLMEQLVAALAVPHPALGGGRD